MASKASSAGPDPTRLPPAVLVVEDDQDVAMTINDVVEERGYRAICVPNGRAALSALELERPALMLVDLFMPVMNGAEFLKVVKKTPRLASIPRVIMTARQRPDDRHQGRRHRPVQAGRLRRADGASAAILRARPSASAMTLATPRHRGRGQGRGRWWLIATLAAAVATTSAACKSNATLGPPDSFLVLGPVGGPGAKPSQSKTGLPVFEALPVDDPHAVPVHQQLAIGFGGEVLRTDYLAKQLVRDIQVGGRGYGPGPRAAAAEPTVLVLGGRAPAGAPIGWALAMDGTFGAKDHLNTHWAGLDAYPDHDPALPQTLAGVLGLMAAARVANANEALASHPLVVGYARALEVIAREWRVGDGPAGMVQTAAGTAAQRQLFTAVRGNSFVLGADGMPRAPGELLGDPGVTATVLYRLAQSKTVGRKVAPDDVYAPFVKDRVPEGVSPAAVLGPFRNFQAKLLSAWARAVLEGNPPRDIADLVDAYGRALPAERSEVVRIFVVTTFGATVKAGGVRPPDRDPGTALPELTALAAQVAAGKLSSHAALAAP